MPNISASDYTAFIKAQAASYAYRDGLFPTRIQTSAQPYMNKSALNAQLLASQAAAIVTPRNSAVASVNGVIPRVRPYTGKGNVNQPKALSTVHNSTSTVQSSGKFPQAGGLPLTAAKSDGVYAPVAHLARVDTKATGAYAKTIPGGSYTNNINTGVSPG
jgi:hypothetical protein